MVPLRSVLLSCPAGEWSFNCIECSSSRFGTSVNIRRWQNEATTLSVNTGHQSLSDTASQPTRTDPSTASTNWTECWVGSTEETNILPLLGMKSWFLGHPAHSPVTVPTEVSQHFMIWLWIGTFNSKHPIYTFLCVSISDLELHSLHQFYQKLMLKCTELNITNTNPPTIITNIPQKHLYTKLTKNHSTLLHFISAFYFRFHFKLCKLYNRKPAFKINFKSLPAVWMRKITAAVVYLMKNCKDMKINMNSSQLLYSHMGGGNYS